MHNRKVPDIVKKLVEEERLRTLQSKVQSAYKELKNQEEALSKGESDKSIFFNDEEDEESRLISDDNLESYHNTLTNIDEIYRIIFENSLFGITIVDNQERIVSWNTHAEELLNLTENELYFKPVESLYPVEEWEKIRAENVRQKGIKYRMETQLIRKDHGPFAVELSLCVLRGEDGKNVGTLGIIKDISKLKITQNKLDDSEERFKTIFNNSAVAITVTNSKEQIISWNNYAEKLLGYSEKDLLMKHVSILYPPDEWAKIRSENVRQKGMQHHLETKIICKNNKEIDVDISLSVLKNYEGNIIGSIGIIRDITERKKVENDLNISLKNQEIITEISRLFNGLEDFNTKMNKSFKILGKSINVSRVYVFEDYDDGKMTLNTFEWCNESIESQIDNLQDLPYDMFPSFKEILAKKGLIKSSDIKDLPKDIYDVLAPKKIKSILILPLKTDEKTYGFIGFDDCIKHKKWSKNEIELLTAVTQVLTVSYQRKKAEDELKKQTIALADANIQATELVENLEKSQTELKEKIDELERFKKVTVGRELKMIELKGKIEELENKEEKNEN